MPPMRSAGARYLSPNMAPTLTPMADNRQVITPISPAAGRMFTCMAAKLTPTANASMLVAMASGSMALAE